MKVMLADIETDASAIKSLHNFGLNVRGVTCDVADAVSVERAAKTSYEANVHVVCNYSGVADGSGVDNISLDPWRWVLDVNLMGVLHGTSLRSLHTPAPMAKVATSLTPHPGLECRAGSDLARRPQASSRWSTSRKRWRSSLRPLGIG